MTEKRFLDDSNLMDISIVGGGYVGLVTGACLADLGHIVSLIEIDIDKVAMINSGNSPIFEPGLEKLIKKHSGKCLSATNSYELISDTDITFICVGTPPLPNGNADLSMVRAASESIGEALESTSRDHTIVVKSTLLPGTTESLVIPTVLSFSGKKNIGFIVNPEFLREGQAIKDFMQPDRIIIGSNEVKSTNVVLNAYSKILAPIFCTTIPAAEMIKFVSNAFLATKISFANEIGNICKHQGIDVYEVMKGVGMDPRISPHFLNAGIGYGGSCFPKDLSALINYAQELGEDPVLLRSTKYVNDNQPKRMVSLLEKRLGDIDGKKIAILGLAFKPDTDDIRESRAIPVIQQLLQLKANITAFDPVAIPAMHALFPSINYATTAVEALKDADACLIMTEWPEFSKLNEEFRLMRNFIVIEGRRILSIKEKEGICW